MNERRIRKFEKAYEAASDAWTRLHTLMCELTAEQLEATVTICPTCKIPITTYMGSFNRHEGKSGKICPMSYEMVPQAKRIHRKK